MIKKSILTVLLISFVCFSASARLPLVDLGVKAGVTTQNVKFNKTAAGNYGFTTSDKTGFHLGFQSRVNLMMFHIQPEIIYTHTAYSMNVQQNGGGSSDSKVKINNIDVPVLFGVKMLMLRVQFGPSFNLMTDSKVSGGKYLNDVTVTRPSVSYMVGAGLDLSRFTLDVRYNGGFTRTKQNFRFDNLGHDFKSRNNRWMFSLGYMF